MTSYAALPLALLHFWYIEAPWSFFSWFSFLNKSFLQITSLPLLCRTFFQPVKNEYRKGLVAFSIGMGIVMKSILIICAGVVLLCLLIVEGAVLVAFLLIPVSVFALLVH